MASSRFKTSVRALAVLLVLATGGAYLAEQRAQQHYLSLYEACNVAYDALPRGVPTPADWRSRCDLNTPDADIVQALRALDVAQLWLFGAVAACIGVLAVPTIIYLRNPGGGRKAV